MASSSSRAVMAVPQSNDANTFAGKRSMPMKTQSVPDGPNQASPYAFSGSPPNNRDPLTA